MHVFVARAFMTSMKAEQVAGVRISSDLLHLAKLKLRIIGTQGSMAFMVQPVDQHHVQPRRCRALNQPTRQEILHRPSIAR